MTARSLVRRLQAVQERRQSLDDAGDQDGAATALDLAMSLCADVPWAILRDALLHATNPASVPPIPVVLGPQDVAAVIGAAEITALIDRYGQAAHVYGKSGLAADGKACQRAWRELVAAIEPLCGAVPAYELGGGRS